MKSFFVILLLPFVTLAQPTIDYTYSAAMDYILLNYSDEENSDSYLSELCDYYHQNRIELNSDNLNKLKEFPFIDELDLKKLNNNLPLESIKNIIEIIGEPKAALLQHFIKLSSDNPVNKPLNIFYRTKSISSKNLNSFNNNNQLAINYNSYKLNIITDKDYTENNLTDFVSGNVQINKFKDLSIIIGDYTVKFGKGLVKWGAYPFAKSENFQYTATKGYTSVKPYLSTNESIYNRGIAIKYKAKERNIMFYYSQNKLDGSLDSTGNVLSFSYTGLHSSENELKKRHNTSIETLGGFVDIFRDNFFSASAFYSHNSFDRSFIIGATKSIKQFDLFSLYLNYSKNLITSNLEISKYKSDYSITGAFKYSYNRNFKYVLSLRNIYFQKFNIYQNPLSEKKGITKEYGILNGIQFNNNLFKLKFYFDIYKTIDFENTRGKEFVCSLFHNPIKTISINFRYKQKIEDYNNSIFNRKSIRLLTKIKLNRRNSINIRIDKSFYINYNSISEGYSIYSDYIFTGESFSIKFRYQQFNIQDYDSRIYTYESSLSNSFENKLLLGNGFNSYIHFLYNLSQNISFILKYGYSEYYYKSSNIVSRKLYLQFEYNL